MLDGLLLMQCQPGMEGQHMSTVRHGNPSPGLAVLDSLDAGRVTGIYEKVIKVKADVAAVLV